MLPRLEPPSVTPRAVLTSLPPSGSAASVRSPGIWVSGEGTVREGRGDWGHLLMSHCGPVAHAPLESGISGRASIRPTAAGHQESEHAGAGPVLRSQRAAFGRLGGPWVAQKDDSGHSDFSPM